MTTETNLWAFRDESFYEFLKQKYRDRQGLQKEADAKRKALEKTKDTDPMYHRMAVSSEMANLRLDMAYIVDRNNQLEQYIETISYLHQRVDLLEGAYGHMRMMSEGTQITSEKLSKCLKGIDELKKKISEE